ncbi:MAG TPA: magnesium-translocating P-type ATPase [Puia sp.]|nr:magnesium-translocating P-type ATPase [Puia sp.]
MTTPPKPDITETGAFWTFDTKEALRQLSGDPNGLSTAMAEERLQEYGSNTLRPRARATGIGVFLSQFKSPITLLLIASAILSMALGDTTDALIILVIILISSLLGFWQEKGATRAVEELLKLVQIRCRLVRDGTVGDWPAGQVVPGDIVVLSAGDVIPGDGLLMESNELFVDEAAFTGETFPVEKHTGIVPADTPLSGRFNTLYMGSHVVSGRGRALVVRTGRRTEFGRISDRLRLRQPETEFEHGIRRFGYLLMEITLILTLVIFATNVLLHKPVLDSFLFSLALAVGLTPQLLPAIITINLSVGAREMARKRVIVKRLASIENFGSMDVLCSDKTGTITAGKVTIRDVLDVSGAHSDKALRLAALNASLQQGFQNPIDDAICAAYGTVTPGSKPIAEIPYDFLRKRLTVQVTGEPKSLAISKGALKEILSICSTVETEKGELLPLDDRRAQILGRYQALSAAGNRVLGIAYKEMAPDHDLTRDDEKDMVFLGFIALFDPPKKAADLAIRNLSGLGVRLKLITGDNALVAASIAGQIGLAEAVIVTGADIRGMSDEALRVRADQADIFAEVEPNQKERIILQLKKAGHVVGFMGDGINDAPALHSADVGISVNDAVDVAKEAADIVLLDQDFDVLAAGIVVGRKTFTNTMKYVFMATSANFGNMFSMAGASLFLPFLPLLPKQILLTNLLTDFPEMTIATDRVDPVMIERPRRWDIRFIQRFMLIFGLLSSIFDYLTFGVLLLGMKAGERTFQTGWFIESVMSAALIVLVVRTRLPFVKSPPGKWLAAATGGIVLFVLALPLTPLAGLFGFCPLPLVYYGWIALIVAGYVGSAELLKHWFYRKFSRS